MESTIALRNRYADEVARSLQNYAHKRKWNLSGMRVYADRQNIKVDFGPRKYLTYVNEGTRPFLMYELEGKVIPIGGGFRKVQGVGLPGIVSFERNGVTVHQMRWQKWRHPGIQGQHFVEQAFKDADEALGPEIIRLRAAQSARFAIDSFKEMAEKLRWRR